jgi:hypothetical protein
MRSTKILTLVLALCAFIGIGLPAAAQFPGPQSFADTLIPVTAGQCPGSVTAGVGVVYNGIPAVGTGLMVLTTPFAPVYQTQSTGAASTSTFTCEIPCPMRSTFGRGCSSIMGFAFFYGVQTTAATSENAPVCGTVAFPVPGAAETPSTVAFVNAPVTAVPTVGTANLGLTTAGAFVNQFVSITTPISLPTAAGTIYQKLFCTFSFGQTAAAAQVINTPGGVAFTTNTIGWMRKHGKHESVDAMVRYGIDPKAATAIWDHYSRRKAA